MKLFDKVTYSSSSNYRLHCSTYYYPHAYPYAYVVSLNPLILISESGDMKWSCLSKPEELIVINSNDSLPIGTIQRCVRDFIGDYTLPELKQVIIVRNDLRTIKGTTVRTGKLIAQACHASLESYTKSLELSTMLCKIWKDNGAKKICLAVNSEEELLDLYSKLELTNIPIQLITDNGLTELLPNTKTALGIGPWYAEEINKFTKDLSLF